ncbi:MAG TPA: hypothetical protein VFF73_01910, partial [Planctomycetota bacterium]|nr:hypothetical protein [Planctomycetota bacterium]
LPREQPAAEEGGGQGDTSKEKKEKPDPAPAAKGAGKRGQSYGSMTCSGVAALVISKSELEKDKAWWAQYGAKVDQGIRDGCAWLAAHFSVRTNPGSGGWYYYYMYSVERAGVLAGTYELGKHDWYDEGALRLLELQSADGSWPTNGKITEHCDTCFALLFLERGTIPLVKLPPKRTVTGVGGAEPQPQPQQMPSAGKR